MKKARTTVLLIPGIAGGNTFFLPFRDDLRARGEAAECWRRSPLVYRRPIARDAERLGKDLLALSRKTGAPVRPVGWSKGGLVTVGALRYLTERFGDPSSVVDKAVVYASPFEGTWPAHLGPLTDALVPLSISELRPGSPVLAELVEFLHRPRTWGFHAVYGTRDVLVPPPRKSLDPAWCHHGDWDHRSLLYDRGLFDLIHSLLTMP